MNNIANERRKLGITQSALAQACGGWGASRIGNYESGKRHPDLTSCRIIVQALNKLGGKTNLDSLFPPQKAA
ncbi:helix-turn-helix transcriptional regulator [Pantoea sp. 1.19]|uniref:helix-turn-helix transcriptional regulator n=1 Tax=Pantoea sp. 1.19 TaxID=1925589 RepID=UPI000948EBAE|nr:helix-turn-helix transcriptional regulator [Pantoea sp. 1.19]